MALKTESPAPTVVRRTGLGVEVAGRQLHSDLTPFHALLQAQRLASRFGFSPERARAVAELAFMTIGARE